MHIAFIFVGWIFQIRIIGSHFRYCTLQGLLDIVNLLGKVAESPNLTNKPNNKYVSAGH